MKGLNNTVSAFWQISQYFFLYLPSLLLFKRKHYWLISERGDDARDNGYWMFKYLREHHPNINAIYVIDPRSVDAGKVKKCGPTLKKGSLKHWLVFISADVRMSTHLFLFAPSPYAGQWLKRHHIKHSINVDLQHGITHNRFPSTFKEVNGSDLYICGAKPEHDWVINTFHWDNQTAVLTGFARFDGLHSFQTKNQILIMPSWRTDLRDLSEELFLESEFYKRWNRLLNHPSLIGFAEANHTSILFYIHYSLQKYAKLFKTPSPRIVSSTFEQNDVQQLLKESKLLVTDYSSVFFDFAYMHKPLIYFQFDEVDFYNKHYQRGFFVHERDGFGPVARTEEEVIRFIEDAAHESFRMSPGHESRINTFFPLHDTHNCERIYNAIINRQHEKESK